MKLHKMENTGFVQRSISSYFTVIKSELSQCSAEKEKVNIKRTIDKGKTHKTISKTKTKTTRKHVSNNDNDNNDIDHSLSQTILEKNRNGEKSDSDKAEHNNQICYDDSETNLLCARETVPETPKSVSNCNLMDRSYPCFYCPGSHDKGAIVVDSVATIIIDESDDEDEQKGNEIADDSIIDNDNNVKAVHESISVAGTSTNKQIKKTYTFGSSSKSAILQPEANLEKVQSAKRTLFADVSGYDNGNSEQNGRSLFKRTIDDLGNLPDKKAGNVELSPSKKTKIDEHEEPATQTKGANKVRKKFQFGSSTKKILVTNEVNVTKGLETDKFHVKRTLFPSASDQKTVEEVSGSNSKDGGLRSTSNDQILTAVTAGEDLDKLYSSNATSDEFDINFASYGINATELESYSPSFNDSSSMGRTAMRDSLESTTSPSCALRVRSLCELQNNKQCDQESLVSLGKIIEDRLERGLDELKIEINHNCTTITKPELNLHIEELGKHIQSLKEKVQLYQSPTDVQAVKLEDFFEEQTNTSANSKDSDCDLDAATVLFDDNDDYQSLLLENVKPTICKRELQTDEEVVVAEIDVKVPLDPQVASTSIANESLVAAAQISSDFDENQDSFLRSVLTEIWTTVQTSPNLYRLLSPEDLNILKYLFVLPLDYQEICMRLYTRQSKWHQVDKFIKEIKIRPTDLYDCLDQLESLHFIHQDYQSMESLETLLNLLLLPDLKKVVKVFRLKITLTKQSLIDKLLKHVSEQQTVTASSETMAEVVMRHVVENLGKCIKLDDSLRVALFRLQLLYHFPLANILTPRELYLYVSEIRTGKVTLPTFYVTTDLEIFTNCEEFISYANAAKLYYEYASLKENRKKSKIEAQLLKLADEAYDSLKTLNGDDRTSSSGRFTAHYLYSKLLTWACKDLTKKNEPVQKWLEYLLRHNDCASKRGEWYLQLAMHLKRYDKNMPSTLDTINKGLLDPEVNLLDKYQLSFMMKRTKFGDLDTEAVSINLVEFPTINTIQTTIISAKPVQISKKIGNRMQYENDTNFMCSVEEIAKIYYEKQGYPNGVHCEGAIVMTLFTILFWDILYANVRGAFISELQFMPLDLYSKEFYTSRKTAIDLRLEEIGGGWEDDAFFGFMRQWEVDHLHEKSLHSPHLVDGHMVIESAICITRPKLARILERLVKDIRQFQAGMPDLFLWNPQTKQCLFSEVKSQNDILSMKQKAWLCFLQEIGVPAEICLVNSEGAKKTRTSAK